MALTGISFQVPYQNFRESTPKCELISFLDVTWGYMNMLPHEDYFLNITALKTTQQPSNDKCIVDCIETIDCFSINAVQQANSTVQCQLLSGNKHRNSTEYVTRTGSTHLYIPVSVRVQFFYQ